MDALACPSIRCTAFTLAPALTARLAAVWRRSWGVMAGEAPIEDLGAEQSGGLEMVEIDDGFDEDGY
jgi:hypothetical protein